ncbi:hypothetical protein VTN77DRAFT_7375 [Rasamsonia byssochlamydoides]|uniref:uncharacterized protein n=1 Tax=Rasamsonia byssochlamydoides TaxID=89139 RepID=UPI0037445096
MAFFSGKSHGALSPKASRHIGYPYSSMLHGMQNITKLIISHPWGRKNCQPEKIQQRKGGRHGRKISDKNVIGNITRVVSLQSPSQGLFFFG